MFQEGVLHVSTANHMIRFAARRLILGALTLWAVSVLVFISTELLPGDVATAILGQEATPETVAALQLKLGLDRPAYVRYVEWFRGFLQGDLGTSLASGRPVLNYIDVRLKNTLWLAGVTTVITVPIAIALGLVTVAFADRALDRGISFCSLFVISLPDFFIGLVLALVFAVHWRLLPAASFRTDFTDPFVMLRAVALPATTLALTTLAHILRMTRVVILDVLRTSYIETAILKGASKGRIIVVHSIPNAIGPIASVIALNLGYLVSGVVIVEVVFTYPGLGRLLVDSVAIRDVPVVQSTAMIFCTAYVGLNLVADLLAVFANPRLRYAQ